MMALFTMTILMVIASEMMYQTSVEYLVSTQSVNQVKAHYAAKAGAEISLFRIYIYRKALAMVGSSVPQSMLDPIWQLPFTWPPMLPTAASGVDKDEIKALVKQSGMQATYVAQIESEGAKIDVNELDSPSKVIAEATRKQIMQIFQAKLESDESFSARHRIEEFVDLVDNLKDWIDADQQSESGGTERERYGDRGSDYIPANQPFKTIDELHLVVGMTDEIFSILAPRLTVFGSKGINVNYASRDVLMSLTPLITAQRADQIIKDRASSTRGPFKDEKDFVEYLASQLNISPNPFRDEQGSALVPLIFTSEINFRIHSIGQAGRAQREITAIVFDTDQIKGRLKTQIESLRPTPEPSASPNASNPSGSGANTPTPTPTPTPSPTPSQPKNGPPNIVYWNET